MWDVTSQSEVKKVELGIAPADIEISQDGSILTIPHGHNVTFYNTDTYVLIVELAAKPYHIESPDFRPDFQSSELPCQSSKISTFYSYFKHVIKSSFHFQWLCSYKLHLLLSIFKKIPGCATSCGANLISDIFCII